jgi:GntR family transcriptional regulator
VEAGGLWQRSIVRTLSVRTDCEIAARLDAAVSTSLIYLERLRVRDEIPLALDQVWLPAELAQPLLRADFTHASLYDELASRARVRLTAAWDRIETVILSSAERAILGCSSQVGAFRIVREGFSGVRRVEWRQTLVRGDRLKLRSELSTPSTPG